MCTGEGRREALLEGKEGDDSSLLSLILSLSGLFEPNSSPSTQRVALASSLMRSKDLEVLRVLFKSGDPMRRGGMGAGELGWDKM
jgi:hypothetical protein